MSRESHTPLRHPTPKPKLVAHNRFNAPRRAPTGCSYPTADPPPGRANTRAIASSRIFAGALPTAARCRMGSAIHPAGHRPTNPSPNLNRDLANGTAGLWQVAPAHLAGMTARPLVLDVTAPDRFHRSVLVIPPRLGTLRPYVCLPRWHKSSTMSRANRILPRTRQECPDRHLSGC